MDCRRKGGREDEGKRCAVSDSVKIKPVKGRPMLHWVGKTAPREVQDFPSQLVESFGVAAPLADPTWKSLQQEWRNLLFHGDNMEILSTLLVGGFRGKVDLIYIDPPFDSGADYVRRVALRGHKDKVLKGEGGSLIEEKQYEDIWANDTYLQYMYERLLLLRELLSEQGSIYLHCDWHKSHHLRFLMDEVFGVENFVNEIIWHYPDNFQGNVTGFATNHNNIFWYSKSEKFIANKIMIPLDKTAKRDKRVWSKEEKKLVSLKDDFGKIIYEEFNEKKADTVWVIGQTSSTKSTSGEHTGYPTQKPEKFLERVITTASNEGSLVMDCFCGSGTTAVVAERLGRRWIACDMNKGAIQTTKKRLLKQKEKSARPFALYRVNNYDFQEQDHLKERIAQKYGVEKIPSDMFFDGKASEQLVKIAPLNRPLSAKDIEDILAELKARPKEARNILLIGYGSERSIHAKAEEHNRLTPINKIAVCDIQQDRLYAAQPSQAEVDFQEQAENVLVTLKAFFSPTIMQRLNSDRTVFDEDIGDFKATIDYILIDNNYDGKTFRIVESDIPAKKTDFVKGTYAVKKPHAKAVIAVKIVDMLGEETLVLSTSTKPS